MKMDRREIRRFIYELNELLRDKPLEEWKKVCEEVVDIYCFLDPNLWEQFYKDYRIMAEILKHCIKIKKLMNKLKKEVVMEE